MGPGPISVLEWVLLFTPQAMVIAQTRCDVVNDRDHIAFRQEVLARSTSTSALARRRDRESD
jgi:hypothetical protein